ncbi:unnamed protein product [Gongylonema pulchrum]|uniref:Conserved plasma membrane protein n=1 Tax=Gongylonema pulchrum TaxID=637853 RepID=A0A183CY40_9BILA|nr:unnamed protein product [Gongylonema pulchrum]
MKRALCTVVDRVQCGGVVSSVTRRRVDVYACPTKLHSEEENRCCDPPEFNCCREPTFFENYLTVIFCVALVAAFAALTALSTVCLCWEKCLLHKLVRRRPTLDYMARPEETEHLNGISVPSEHSAEKRTYEVNSDIVYRLNKDSL